MFLLDRIEIIIIKVQLISLGARVHAANRCKETEAFFCHEEYLARAQVEALQHRLKEIK